MELKVITVSNISQMWEDRRAGLLSYVGGRRLWEEEKTGVKVRMTREGDSMGR